MILDLGAVLFVVCFGLGCVVRVLQAGRSESGRSLNQAAERVRLQVRRPATDAPVDGRESGRRDDDPLLDWRQE